MMAPNLPHDGVAIIRWLEQAVTAYERNRGQLAKQAVMIGYALICVRDFGQRGALSTLHRMQAFSRSENTLKRCLKCAQIYADQRGLTLAETGKLKEPQEAASLFQADFDFSDESAHPLARDIAAYVGSSTVTDLLERDLLDPTEGRDSPPQGHQAESAKRRALKEPAELRRFRYKKHFHQWATCHGAGDWQALYLHGNNRQGDLGTLDLETFLEAALKAVREHNKAESAKEVTCKAPR
jgi:hypothetical protein